jgi:CRP-like cAMP-binding protein
MAVIDTLKRSDLFGTLDNNQLSKVANLCRGVSFREGEIIFKEGDEAKELYILTDGRVVLELELRPVPKRFAIPTAVEVVSKDEFFGWSALVEPHVYNLSSRCMTNCTALAIKGDILRKAMADNAALGYEVMKKLSALIGLRLAHTRLRLISGIGLILLDKELKLSE